MEKYGVEVKICEKCFSLLAEDDESEEGYIIKGKRVCHQCYTGHCIGQSM